jgi:hypothetical protein
MRELRRPLVAQDARRGEPVGECLGLSRIEIGKRRSMSQLDACSEDRDGAREALGLRPQGSQARHDRSHDPRGSHRLGRRSLRGQQRRTAVGDDLVKVERVPARGDMARPADLVWHPWADGTPQQRRARLLAQRRERHRLRLGRHVQEQLAASRLGSGRSRGQHEQQRQRRRATGEVSDPLQRRDIRPLRVVDGEQQPPIAGQRHAQPEQPVHHRAEVDGGRGAPHRRVDGRACQCSRALQQPGLAAPVTHERCEQLAHDTERQRALSLRPARSQHAHSLGRSPIADLVQKPRLPDSRRPLDQESPALAGARNRARRTGHPPECVASLKQRGSRRLHGRARRSRMECTSPDDGLTLEAGGSGRSSPYVVGASTRHHR